MYIHVATTRWRLLLSHAVVCSLARGRHRPDQQGVAAALLTNPLDLVKVRLQVDRRGATIFGYRSLWDGAIECNSASGKHAWSPALASSLMSDTLHSRSRTWKQHATRTTKRSPPPQGWGKCSGWRVVSAAYSEGRALGCSSRLRPQCVHGGRRRACSLALTSVRCAKARA